MDASPESTCTRQRQAQDLGIIGLGEYRLASGMLDRLTREIGRNRYFHPDRGIEPVPEGVPECWLEEESRRFVMVTLSPFCLKIKRLLGEVILAGLDPPYLARIIVDPTTFSKLKRVVFMGGSIDRGYGDSERMLYCMVLMREYIVWDPVAVQNSPVGSVSIT